MNGGKSPGECPAATGHARPGASRPGTAPTGGDVAPAGGSGIRIPPYLAHGDEVITALWPLRDSLELGAVDRAAPLARLHARQVLGEWGLARRGESAELIITELITNALTASRALAQPAPVQLWLASDLAWILIAVGDASPQCPVWLNVGGEAEHGRGLMLVDALSWQWGWSRRSAQSGKIVWALAR